MNPVFLDTVGLLALWDNNDQWHAGASKAFQTLQADRLVLSTTSLVLFECANAAARRTYRSAPYRLWTQLQAGGWLIHPTSEDIHQGWENYQKGTAGEAGIVDHISFAVMRRLELTQAFTNDRHFRAAGFEPLF